MKKTTMARDIFKNNANHKKQNFRKVLKKNVTWKKECHFQTKAEKCVNTYVL